ncbi:hypothetical protein SAMN05216228_1005284 [Rhizobium tibeticum]|uniref:Uncharacterized protein n=1 Tax=Rhizobium tibeticum TaxID=501024 RepID=A0A1H8HUA7_9HYPH|nr:hypothetical protein RTCCBAU85039_1790 [Rhizobium tibeticum]SEN59749.1 hypothetical protein SAMN05216228_1005284 [Rhizobium tibeticum]
MLGKQSAERLEDTHLPCRFEGFAGKQITWSLVGDRQRVTVAAIAELELALEVGSKAFTPKAPREWRNRMDPLVQSFGSRTEATWLSS